MNTYSTIQEFATWKIHLAYSSLKSTIKMVQYKIMLCNLLALVRYSRLWKSEDYSTWRNISQLFGLTWKKRWHLLCNTFHPISFNMTHGQNWEFSSSTCGVMTFILHVRNTVKDTVSYSICYFLIVSQSYVFFFVEPLNSTAIQTLKKGQFRENANNRQLLKRPRLNCQAVITGMKAAIEKEGGLPETTTQWQIIIKHGGTRLRNCK